MRYYVDPFGCVKNQVDAENMMLHLDNAGWSAAQDAADADIIIVNSCGFIQSAKQESINAVLGWRKLYPGKKILLAGCLAQRYAKDLAESLPEADGFFGVDDISQITEKMDLLVKTSHGGRNKRSEGTLTGTCDRPRRTIKSSSCNNGSSPLGERVRRGDTETRRNKEGSRITPGSPCLCASVRGISESFASRPLLSFPGSAYVKISEGCDNRCSFCAIPLIRGPLRCRAAPDIVEECKGLLVRGIKELCIIGQDIGSYFAGGMGLPELLNAIAELPGDFWVRLLYIHPDHFPMPILELMERDARFLPYFDIPFQHGSPEILRAMNRRGAAENYLALAETIRSRLPAAVIRTTFLLGFPGETDADFASLVDFQKKLRPDWLGCFCYSREEDTPAFAMKKQVSQKVAASRKQEIEERQIPITEQNMDRFVGKNLNVLLEEQFSGSENGEADDNFWLGRLYCHAPEVDGAAVVTGGGSELKAGDILFCKVIARRGFDLEVRVR